MRRNVIAMASLACLLLGCEACPHYNRTQVISPTGMKMRASKTDRKPYGTVKLYQVKPGQDKPEVPVPYEVIALMSVSGSAGEEAMFITAFLYRAADIGADGVIFYRGVQGAVSAAGPVGIPMTSVESAYRGEAIRHLKN